MPYYVLCVRFTSLVRIDKKKPILRQRRNTRYWWLVRPYQTRTFTLLEMTSFACRTTPLILHDTPHHYFQISISLPDFKISPEYSSP